MNDYVSKKQPLRFSVFGLLNSEFLIFPSNFTVNLKKPTVNFFPLARCNLNMYIVINYVLAIHLILSVMTSFEQQLKMFDTMNFYISKGQTGTPAEFAALLCIQLPTFYTHLRYMRKKLKNEKISILYDHSEKTYIYSRPGSFTIGWTWAAAS